MITKEEEILLRLDRIETMIEKMAEQPQFGTPPVKEKAPDPDAASDQIGRMMRQITEERQGVSDRDYLFYLADMEKKLEKEREKLGLMQKNLDQNRQVYVTKQGKLAAANSLTKPAVVMPSAATGHPAPAPEVSDSQSTDLYRADLDADRKESRVGSISDDITSQTEAEPITTEEQIGISMFEAGQSQMQTPKQSMSSGEYTAQIPQSTQIPQSDRAKQKNVHTAEYNVGGIVLSVVGAVFVILSMVYFGKIYMDNLAQGIALFAIGGLIIVFSELVLRRHLESFSRVISGVGLGVLYTATILNYLYLNTIKAPVAILITLAISVFALFFSRKKDSGFLRIIGILGCYISFVPLKEFENVTDFAIPAVILLIVNALYLYLPERTYRKAVQVVHAIANVLISGYFAIVLMVSQSEIREDTVLYMVGFLAGFIVINTIIFRKSESQGSQILSICAETIFSILLLILLAKSDHAVWGAVIAAAGYGISLWLSWERESLRWVHLYCYSVFLAGVMLGQEKNVYLCVVAGIVLCYKLLDRFKKLSVANLLATCYGMFVFLVNMKDESNMQFLILGVLVVSLLFLNAYKTIHECLVLLLLCGYAYLGFDQLEIAILLALGFIVLLLVLYRIFEHLRDEQFIVYMVMSALLGVLSCLFAAGIDRYKYVALTGVLLLGLLLLFLLFSKSFGFLGEWGARNRNLIIAIFLTYMVLIFRIEKPVITSIILMVLALCGVGIGFGIRQKPLRLYGLFLSVFVCAKLLLYDFSESGSGEKVVLFFVVGLLAIGISYLYLRLEKQEG